MSLNNQHRLEKLNSQKVLVLSTGYEPLFKTNWKRALSAVFSGRAEVVEEHETIWVGTTQGKIQLPMTVRFVTGVIGAKIKNIKKTQRPSKKLLYHRDNGKCQYCEKKLKICEATIDHVTPKSRGGQDTWQNLVIACTKCNQRKGDRRPSECSMKLSQVPKAPPNFIPVVL